MLCSMLTLAALRARQDEPSALAATWLPRAMPHPLARLDGGRPRPSRPPMQESSQEKRPDRSHVRSPGGSSGRSAPPPDPPLRHQFPLPYACDPLDRIVHPGQVLDVRGRHDIDVGAEQLIDVLPALSRRLPGTVRWASSSTNATAGRRARTASTSRSPKEVPR